MAVRKPWYRWRNFILLALLLLATAVGRQVYLAMTAKPGSAVDFAAALQELSERNQPPDGGPGTPNGWAILIEAIERANEAEERVYPAVTRRSSVVLDYSSLTSPDTKKGMYDNTYTMEEARDLARKGLAELRANGVFDKLDELSRTRRAVQPIPQGPLFSILLPELGRSRNLARANGARMHLAHIAGDDKEFIEAFEQSLALGRVLSHQGTLLISHLVGIAITALAEGKVREALTERPFGEETCMALLAAMDRQLPLAPITLAFEGERLCVLDAIQWTHTDDGRGSGRMMVSAWRQLGGFAGGGPVPGIGGSLLDWKIVDVVGIAFPSKAASVKKANEFYDMLVAYAKLTPRERAASRTSPDVWVTNSLPRRYVILHLLLPAVSKAIDSRTQSDMCLGATRIMLGLEIYHARHGVYPDKLDDLVPGVLASLPEEPFSGSWCYKLLRPEDDQDRRADGSPRPYLLYSTGADTRDNGGRVNKKNPYTALRPSTGVGLDWVANTPRDRPEEKDETEDGDAQEDAAPPSESPTQDDTPPPVPTPTTTEG